MKRSWSAVAMVLILGTFQPTVHAQKAPEAGYVFPAGGKAGTTIDVHLGGYDWTPDMEFFVHDPRVKLTASAPPGPILIPAPPYWFGAKGRLSSLPLPREVPAKITVPADMPPGPIYWQAANANGCTIVRSFIVGNGTELVEDEGRKTPQSLPSLPITASGRLLKNEEVDRYRFVVTKAGPITCELMARRLGSKFHGVLEVHDAKGALIIDALGAGGDPRLTFVAKAGGEYVVSVRDIDFGGDRSYVYRLSVTPGPRIVGTIPAAAKHGETREVEFIVDTGTGKLDSIKRPVAFPAKGNTFNYQLDTPLGKSPTYPILLSDEPGITGVLDQPDGVKAHAFNWKKGEVWSLALEARRIGSPLDVAFAILGPDGKEVAKSDDLPGTTDAGLDFTAPADGAYQVVVSDMAGRSGTRAAIYRLVVRRPMPDFYLRIATPRLSVPIGSKASIPVQVIRKGGFKGPIALSIKGLLAGVGTPANLVIPGDKAAFTIPLDVAKDAGTLSGIVSITGSADLASTGAGVFSRSGPPARAETTVTRVARTSAGVNLSPRGPDDDAIGSILVATTLKPRFKGQPVDQDTGRKVHRGSTHPAEIIVERLDGFAGEIVLQQSATQSYQVQGITGADIIVPPGIGKTIFPCFMPEWLETTRTSRMGIVAVAKAADPKGKIRWVCAPIVGYVTMTMEGALLKISAEDEFITAQPGQSIDVKLKIARLIKLTEPAKLELRLPPELAGQLKSEAMIVPAGKEHVTMRVTPVATLRGVQTFVIRATAMKDGRYPAISEASVTVDFGTGARAIPPK